MKAIQGSVLVEFALGLTVLTTALIALLEMGRIFWLIVLWGGVVIETARAVSLCPVGQVDLSTINTLTGLPVSPTNLEIDYLPTGCSADGCNWAVIKILPDASGSELANSWWPVALPATSISIGLESTSPIAHPFCPH